MSQSEPIEQITDLLNKSERSEQVEGELLARVYEELRNMAQHFMRGQKQGHSLQPTDLVHDCFLRVCRRDPSSYANKRHFMAVAARAMRSILVDHARRQGRKKRKAGDKRVPLDDWVVSFEAAGDDLIAVHEALNRLELQSRRSAQVVELRFFGGYSYEEIAEILGHSPRTIERDWRFARSQMKVLLDE